MSYASAADFLTNAAEGETFTETEDRAAITYDLVSVKRDAGGERHVIVNRTRTSHSATRKRIEATWLENLSMTVTTRDDGWVSIAHTLRFDAVTLAAVSVSRYSAKKRDEVHAAALAQRESATV